MISFESVLAMFRPLNLNRIECLGMISQYALWSTGCCLWCCGDRGSGKWTSLCLWESWPFTKILHGIQCLTEHDALQHPTAVVWCQILKEIMLSSTSLDHVYMVMTWYSLNFPLVKVQEPWSFQTEDLNTYDIWHKIVISITIITFKPNLQLIFRSLLIMYFL